MQGCRCQLSQSRRKFEAIFFSENARLSPATQHASSVKPNDFGRNVARGWHSTVTCLALSSVQPVHIYLSQKKEDRPSTPQKPAASSAPPPIIRGARRATAERGQVARRKIGVFRRQASTPARRRGRRAGFRSGGPPRAVSRRARPEPSGAEPEPRGPRTARINHPCLTKLFFYRAHRVSDRRFGAKHLVHSVSCSVAWAPCPR